MIEKLGKNNINGLYKTAQMSRAPLILKRVQNDFKKIENAYFNVLWKAFPVVKAVCAHSSLILAKYLEQKHGIPFITDLNKKQLLSVPLKKQLYTEFQTGVHWTEGLGMANWLEVQFGQKRLYLDAVHSSLWSSDKSDRIIFEEIDDMGIWEKKYKLYAIDNVAKILEEAEKTGDIELLDFLTKPLRGEHGITNAVDHIELINELKSGEIPLDKVFSSGDSSPQLNGVLSSILAIK
jgi:hypothetical protein